MRTSVDVHNHLVERDTAHELFNVRGRFRSAERLASVLDLPPVVRSLADLQRGWS